MNYISKDIEHFRSYFNKHISLSNNTFNDLIKEVKFIELKKNQYLLQAGQIAKSIYYVCKGIIISQYLDCDGNMQIKNFFLQGNLAASTVSALEFSPSKFNLKSVENSTLIVINYRKFQEVIFRHEDLKIFYIKYLEEQWVIKNEKRQMSFVTLTASQRYAAFLKEYPGLINRVSLKLIALYLGITPTHFSRIRKEYSGTKSSTYVKEIT